MTSRNSSVTNVYWSKYKSTMKNEKWPWNQDLSGFTKKLSTQIS